MNKKLGDDLRRIAVEFRERLPRSYEEMMKLAIRELNCGRAWLAIGYLTNVMYYECNRLDRPTKSTRACLWALGEIQRAMGIGEEQTEKEIELFPESASWKWGPTEDWRGYRFLRDQEDEDIIELVNGGPLDNPCITMAISAEHARLIAAAPESLKALKTLTNKAMKRPQCSDLEWNGALQDACTAIGKAGGWTEKELA